MPSTPESERFPQGPFPNHYQPEAGPQAPQAPPHLQALRVEQSYLSQNLQHHDERARNLYACLSVAESGLQSAQSPAETRKFRRSKRRLEKNIEQISNQEKSAVSRLSELNIEIQHQERWYENQQKRAAYQSNPFVPLYPPSPSPSITTPPRFSHSPTAPASALNTTGLNPLSPVFVPGMNFGDIYSAGEASDRTIHPTSVEDVGVKNEPFPQGLQWEFVTWESDSDDGSTHGRGHWSPMPSTPKLNRRRLSLPFIRSVW